LQGSRHAALRTVEVALRIQVGVDDLRHDGFLRLDDSPLIASELSIAGKVNNLRL
jgi:hypothetical protein